MNKLILLSIETEASKAELASILRSDDLRTFIADRFFDRGIIASLGEIGASPGSWGDAKADESEVDEWGLSRRLGDQVIEERRRQVAKWGDQSDKGPFVMTAILTEEVGEAAQAALKCYAGEGGKTERDLEEELLQIEAVARAMREYIVRGEWSARIGRVDGLG